MKSDLETIIRRAQDRHGKMSWHDRLDRKIALTDWVEVWLLVGLAGSLGSALVLIGWVAWLTLPR